MSPRVRIRIGGIVAAGAIAAMAIRFCPIPWSGVLLSGGGVLLILSGIVRRSGTRIAMINIAAVTAALAIFETYVGIGHLEGDGTRLEGSITTGFTHPDDVLGYSPNPGSRVTARKYHDETLLYDVVYTIDPEGLRIPPPASEDAMSGCVAFFGDSVTFGEGVNDNETYPYQVGLKLSGRFAVYNVAFSGYGPHQMLASLQSGRVSRIMHCKPTHFIYLAIPEHISRVAGLTFWDKHGPRFELASNGAVIRNGNFDDPRLFIGGITLPKWIVRALESSFTWARFFGIARDPRPADLALFLAVTQESARSTKERFPGSEFHVILWDGRVDDRLDTIESELRAAGIPVHRLTSAIPDVRANWGHYILSIYDPHPNQLQYERLADYIVDRILNRRGH